MTRVLSPGNKFVLPLQSRACFYVCTTRRITPFYFVISSCARRWMHSGNLLHSAKTDDDTLLSYNRRSHSACRALSVCILMFGTFFKAYEKTDFRCGLAFSFTLEAARPFIFVVSSFHTWVAPRCGRRA
jgi:hypothetical protein